MSLRSAKEVGFEERKVRKELSGTSQVITTSEYDSIVKNLFLETFSEIKKKQHHLGTK